VRVAVDKEGSIVGYVAVRVAFFQDEDLVPYFVKISKLEKCFSKEFSKTFVNVVCHRQILQFLTVLKFHLIWTTN
jgi:hypothetical protein